MKIICLVTLLALLVSSGWSMPQSTTSPQKVTFVEGSTFTAERVKVDSEGEIVPLFDGEQVDWAQAEGA